MVVRFSWAIFQVQGNSPTLIRVILVFQELARGVRQRHDPLNSWLAGTLTGCIIDSRKRDFFVYFVFLKSSFVSVSRWTCSWNAKWSFHWNCYWKSAFLEGLDAE